MTTHPNASNPQHVPHANVDPGPDVLGDSAAAARKLVEGSGQELAVSPEAARWIAAIDAYPSAIFGKFNYGPPGGQAHTRVRNEHRLFKREGGAYTERPEMLPELGPQFAAFFRALNETRQRGRNYLAALQNVNGSGLAVLCYAQLADQGSVHDARGRDIPLVEAFTLPQAEATAFYQAAHANPDLLEEIFMGRHGGILAATSTEAREAGYGAVQRVQATEVGIVDISQADQATSMSKRAALLGSAQVLPYSHPVGEVPA
jgi:hypothetical protein